MRTISTGAEEVFLGVWNLCLAAGMMLSPWALSFLDQAQATWNLWLCAGAVLGLAVLSLLQTYDMEEYLLALVGLWVGAAPWLLGFEDAQMPLIAHLGFGIALIVSALAELWRLREAPDARSF